LCSQQARPAIERVKECDRNLMEVPTHLATFRICSVTYFFAFGSYHRTILGAEFVESFTAVKLIDEAAEEEKEFIMIC
jgi:hypothetical protein